MTRSATPAARALTVAILTDSSSMSIPTTAASGYARARAMLDHPPPLPTSSNLAAGRERVSCNVLTADSAGPSRLSYHGRLASACDSRASGPSSSQLTPPPTR